MACQPLTKFLIPLLALFLQMVRGAEETRLFDTASHNGRLANEAFHRSHQYVRGWLKLADSETGLIPRNRKDRYWNAKDAAADNYPFMVLSTWFTERPLFDGKMQDMLRTEIRLTSRINSLPDTYDFASMGFASAEQDLDTIIFGSSEYVKDGLLPLTEWLGQSPWSARMLSILDDIWKHAPVETPHGRIPSTDVEVNGEMLQVLSRVYWMTGEGKYLEWAARLGDYYLLGGKHPTRDMTRLRLRDHGCEIISGLCELYATVSYARPDKKKAYEPHIHEMLDRILEVGANEHGLFLNEINPMEGKRRNSREGLADTWGYTYNGILTVCQIDGTEKYRSAVHKVLSNIHHYRNHNWEKGSSDGYADSIESALNLHNRIPVETAADWIDSEIHVMWGKQKPDGIIEGWHGDGNFARTSIMYALWKTQGVSLHPWREDLVFGAVAGGGGLFLSVTAAKDWAGIMRMDSPRHKTVMKLPIDWPRINQFPEWFTASPEAKFDVHDTSSGDTRTHTGQSLTGGIPLSLKAGETKQLRIIPRPG